MSVIPIQRSTGVAAAQRQAGALSSIDKLDLDRTTSDQFGIAVGRELIHSSIHRCMNWSAGPNVETLLGGL